METAVVFGLLCQIRLTEEVLENSSDQEGLFDDIDVDNESDQNGRPNSSDVKADCKSLKPGQYLCTNLDIDPVTQQPRSCNRDTERAPMPCYASPGIICK